MSLANERDRLNYLQLRLLLLKMRMVQDLLDQVLTAAVFLRFFAEVEEELEENHPLIQELEVEVADGY